MQSETITESRWKLVVPLVAGLIGAPICGLVLLAGMGGAGLWFGLLLFSAMAVLSVITMVRPATLTIDREGFPYGGGWRRPKRYAWSDIDSVYVMARGRGGKLIGVKYREGRRPHDLVDDVGAAMGVDATIPAGWTLSLEAVVARLDAWRTGAV
jgi:hypothetical protein